MISKSVFVFIFPFEGRFFFGNRKSLRKCTREYDMEMMRQSCLIFAETIFYFRFYTDTQLNCRLPI